MIRSTNWLWPVVVWLPIGALFTVLIVSAHGGPTSDAVVAASRMIVAAATLGYGVYGFTARVPWPHPFRLRFVLIHAVAALVYAFAWIVFNSVLHSVIEHRLVMIVGPGWLRFLIMGVWLYLIIAGAAYAVRAAARAAQLEALAARTELAALRAQLHPHFLFNALHTVMQLIPVEPRAASRAAEQLADILRTVLDEQRESLCLREELAFVDRYLAIECLRFGERLVVVRDIDPRALECELPAFAVQTLVENAVRHGAAPNLSATTITIAAHRRDDHLWVSVTDDGVGLPEAGSSAGTGLQRLRQRLSWLYGSNAACVVVPGPGRGVAATLRIPLLEKRSGSGTDDE
ncbi:sensor histidine kinase [Tahibacter amnicola]|uniref:Histidine kinase n=1 Tax=Tahibacter amnicola TaxID=2976241 RepID=A0ABY6BAN2_9GAMM|nr:histidine kinase [Tahibacter amnicola]UXI66857.1 histidine kinase [Tahibacter amnicola]